MAHVLIVDDEPNYLWMIGELLRQAGHEIATAEQPAAALELLQRGDIDVLITDLRMGEMDGMALLARAKALAPWVSTIVMTAYGSIERAVEAMRSGAYDFVLKPFDNRQFVKTVANAVERTEMVRANVRISRTLAEQESQRLVGNSRAIEGVFEKIRRVANAKSTVLITGESGSGKELVARAIHFSGLRRGQPFLAVNCGALTEALAESELFGHQRGAFTGAVATHIGYFEQAQGGTLFLDEIGELSLPLQAKLLRVLDSQEIRRVGSEKALNVDVRIVAATNRNLVAESRAGRFREDLLFRLNVVRIDVPPLRDRREDIPALAELCLAQTAQDGQVRGRRLAPATLEVLMQHSWPGNVRELQNTLAHAALMATDELIQPDDLPIELVAGREWMEALDRILPGHAELDATVKSIERHLIMRALERANGVQARAAEMLGISRSLLQYKLKGMSKGPDAWPGPTVQKT
ncbi:MAG TPA: sigma-54 dependent transcriptional regulator [Nitrospirales bacterium]|nr:sigma-54 dependent transcriptional regulator [Nitrospirales bacterium]